MSGQANVCIVGGGIVGLSCGLHLAEAGVEGVLILERESDVGLGSTGLSAGGLRHQFGSPPNVRFSQYSIDFIRKLAEEEPAVEWNAVGYLFLVRDEVNMHAFEKAVAMQNSLGVKSVVLTPSEIAERFGYVNTAGLSGGTYCPDDGVVDPAGLTSAMHRRAKVAGVKLRLNTAVEGIERGRPYRLITAAGEVMAEHVVLCAGAWSRGLGGMFGVDLPVEPVRRQLYITSPLDVPPMPMTVDYETHWYCRRESGGLLLGRSRLDEPPGYNFALDPDFLPEIISVALERVPLFERAQVARGWAGLYGITPDHTPLIGPLPGVERVWVVAGFSGHGIMHSSAAGRLLAELFTEGSPSILAKNEAALYDPSRFAEGRALSEGLII